MEVCGLGSVIEYLINFLLGFLFGFLIELFLFFLGLS